jgi:NAD(P)H-dependent FMN reductase
MEYVIAAADAARERGYHLVVWTTSGSDLDEVRRLSGTGLVDGVLLMEVLLQDERVRHLQAGGVPLPDVRPVPALSQVLQKVDRWVVDHLNACGDLQVELVDLRDHPLPFFDGLPPARTPREYPSEPIARLGRTLDRADGFVILTAEYNHGYPAVLKNAMDWTFVEWRRKPVAFVGWGNVGGARAIEQLREVAVEFEMAPLRHAVHILPEVLLPARQVSDDADTAAFDPLAPKLKLLVDDLVW